MVGPAMWLYARRHALRCSGGCAWGVYLLSLMLGLIGSAASLRGSPERSPGACGC